MNPFFFRGRGACWSMKKLVYTKLKVRTFFYYCPKCVYSWLVYYKRIILIYTPIWDMEWKALVVVWYAIVSPTQTQHYSSFWTLLILYYKIYIYYGMFIYRPDVSYNYKPIEGADSISFQENFGWNPNILWPTILLWAITLRESQKGDRLYWAHWKSKKIILFSTYRWAYGKRLSLHSNLIFLYLLSDDFIWQQILSLSEYFNSIHQK